MRTLFLLLLSCVSCFAQFGVEQPMFQMTSTGGYPAENLLLFWSKSDFGGSNDVYGTTLTNGATVDHWYYKTSAIPTLLKLDSSNAGTDPKYYTNGPSGYPYYELLGGANSYFAGQVVVGLTDVTRPTMFIVCRALEYGGITRWNIAGGTATWTYLSGLNPFPTVTLWNNGAGIDQIENIPTNQWILLTIGLRDPNQGFVRYNGQTVISNTVAGGLKLTYDLNFAMGIATDVGAGLNKLTDFVEIRAYTNGLQTADMVTIENLLISKYGITNVVSASTLVADYDVNALGLSDGTLVSQLNDQTANAFHLLSSGTARPYWTNNAAVLNDKGFLVFDGVANYMRCINSGLGLAQPYTIYMVCYTMQTGAKRYYDSTNATVTAGMFVDPHQMTAGTVISVSTFSPRWNIFTSVYNATSSACYTNGNFYVYGDAGNNRLDGFTLGANRSASPGAFGDLRVARLIIYNGGQTTATIKSNTAYLNGLYSIY